MSLPQKEHKLDISIPRGWAFNGFIPNVNPSTDTLTNFEWDSLTPDLFFAVSPFAAVRLEVGWVSEEAKEAGLFEGRVVINDTDNLVEDYVITEEFFLTHNLDEIIQWFNGVVDIVEKDLIFNVKESNLS